MKFSKKTFSAVLSALVLTAGASAFDVTFMKVTGKVEFLDGSEWVQAVEGDIIDEGTVVSTGYKSGAVLQTKSATMEIGPMTRITLEKLNDVNGKENTSLFIDSGKIQTQVESGNKFKVRSAVATASVRGTDFTESADGELNVGGGGVDLTPTPEEEAHPMVGTTDDSMNRNANPGTSNVFTSSDEIGDSKGVTVYAGQISTFDTFTGIASSPASEMEKEATQTPSMTYTAAEREGLSSIASGTSSGSAGITSGSSGAGTHSTLTVIIQFAPEN
ncbi:MAG: FecR domain-containing protein [Treponema sp.]|nr:FecR domain-containing protein [Treponema sp.]